MYMQFEQSVVERDKAIQLLNLENTANENVVKKVYSVCILLRSKVLEKLVPVDITFYDQYIIVYQSLSLEKAQKFYETVDEDYENSNYWYLLSKSIVLRGLDEGEHEHIVTKHYNH